MNKKFFDKYPRFRGARKMGPGAICEFCEKPSTHKVEIEVDYFRGNDEVFRCCTEHYHIAQRSAKLLLGEYSEVIK